MNNCKEKFKEIKTPSQVILDEDIASLKKMPKSKRINKYNKIKENEEKFRWDFPEKCPDLFNKQERNEVIGKLLLSRLKIASSLYDEGRLPKAMEDDFIEKELKAVLDFERYKKFDALRKEQIEDKIQRMEGEVYELAKEYNSTQIADMDSLMDDSRVQKNVMKQLLDLYQDRLEKIRRAFYAYVEKNDLAQVVQVIEESIASLHDSAKKREKIEAKFKEELEEISEPLASKIDKKRRQIETKINRLNSLALRDIDKDKKEIEEELDLLKKNIEDLNEIFNRVKEKANERIGKADTIINKINQEIEELKEISKENNSLNDVNKSVKLIENEISQLKGLRSKIKNEKERIKRQKNRIKAEKENIEEKFDEMRNSKLNKGNKKVKKGVEGRRVITSEMARLIEMNYITRFDRKLHGLDEIKTPDRLFEISKGYWKDHSYHKDKKSKINDLRRKEESKIDRKHKKYPTNQSSIYEIVSTNFLGFSKGKEMVIEARVHNNLENYYLNGFSKEPADLSDLLFYVGNAIDFAEDRDCHYLLGIASPTGWSKKVKEQFERKISRGKYSRRLSLCLIDLIENEILFDKTDEIIKSNKDLFTPYLDLERVKECKKLIREKYTKNLVSNNILLEDLVEEDFSRDIVKNAFNELEEEGIGEQLYLDEHGLTFFIEDL
ncbi:MAG: hypothetical protein BTN85_2008 [Candidatus Methanohalarchaeum thermophilum]|uniref:Uncharacterized protein n=1 Tax=Methanohalarchaeum thermophilum TaxID=1903181 RepID=A0A1Q6DSP2_METT1|nr:MAG: hypothetical protein BTN85_2008 [Candidatus Methanohalarchaeum thermophilum]